MVTFQQVTENPKIRTYIENSDLVLGQLGFTCHGTDHVLKVARDAKYILDKLEYDDRTIQLAQIAAYMHDIGNLVNRDGHAQSGAIMAFKLLDNMKMPPEDIAVVVSAIGNHDEGTGIPVNPAAAALIIADKSDVRRSRVRKTKISFHDIHDRVNHSVTGSKLSIHNAVGTRKIVTLDLQVDKSIGSVMDYFEIFLKRMIMCRKAAETLGLEFHLVVNDQYLLGEIKPPTDNLSAESFFQ